MFSNTVVLVAKEGIDSGTSGGHVVTENGLLLGVVSTSGGNVDEPHGEVTIVRPQLHGTRLSSPQDD